MSIQSHVSTQKSVKNILILDDDLGFAMWLGRALNEAGFLALPASKSEEALTIVNDASFPKMDLLIANLDLPGCLELVEDLAARGDPFQLITIGGPSVVPRKRKISARLDRPQGEGALSPEPYLETVRRVLDKKSTAAKRG